MSKSDTAVVEDAPVAEFDPSKVARGPVKFGRGNHRNVTTTRIRPQLAGMSPQEGHAIEKMTAKNADVKFSAGATQAWASVSNALTTKVADVIAVGASEWAALRGSNRVWDIDFAAALGFEVTPGGASAFRKAYNLKTPSTPWPTRPEVTPTAETGGPIFTTEGRMSQKGKPLPVVEKADVDAEGDES